MSHAHRTAAAMKRGQFRWDHMAPPEDGPRTCLDCCGTKHDADGETCPHCGGFGEVTEDGFPYDRKQAERDRDSDMADRLYWREER